MHIGVVVKLYTAYSLFNSTLWSKTVNMWMQQGHNFQVPCNMALTFTFHAISNQTFVLWWGCLADSKKCSIYNKGLTSLFKVRPLLYCMFGLTSLFDVRPMLYCMLVWLHFLMLGPCCTVCWSDFTLWR